MLDRSGTIRYLAVTTLSLSLGCGSAAPPTSTTAPTCLGQPEPDNSAPPPPGEGGISNIMSDFHVGQSLTPVSARVRSVEVSLTDLSPGSGDTLTLRIATADGMELARVSQAVAAPFDGWRRFAFPGTGVAVAPCQQAILWLEGSGRNVFGWRFGPDRYAGGTAMISGPRPQFDFLFRLNPVPD